MTADDLDLIPETAEQRLVIRQINGLMNQIVEWAKVDGGRDHRRRPDIRKAPMWPELHKAITRYVELKNGRK